MVHYCSIIISLFLIVCNECLCDICKTCICSASNADPIVDCHDRHLGTNEVLNFDLLTLDQHRSLNKLILSKNNMVLLPTNELKNLKRLKKLDLSQNQLDHIHSDIFRYIQDLEDLNYSHNLLWSVDISILNTTSLSTLNLSYNQIINLEHSSENITTKLMVLDVSHNNLRNLNFLDVLSELVNLDLSFNELTTLPTDSLLRLQHLKILRVNNNHLLSLNLQNLPLSLLQLHAESNLVNALSLHKSSIYILNIQDNHIFNIDQNLAFLEELKNLNISGNSLSDFPDVFLKNLETLDLSFNNLTIIPETVSFKNFPNLRTLNVSGNRLKDAKIRSELKLERFEVNFVETIKEIDEQTFLLLKERENGCINMTVSNNTRLSTIQEKVFKHMDICSLDLSNNRLTHLSSELLNININNKSISNAKYLINLQGNPFICNCSLQWMLNELIPILYTTELSLLENLRCAGPHPLTNKRMIHWYKWKEKVFCDDHLQLEEKMTVNVASVSNKQIVTFETSLGMIAVLATAIALLAILTIIGILLTRRIIAKRRRINRRL